MYSPKGEKQQRCRRIRVKSSILLDKKNVDNKKKAKKKTKKPWGEKKNEGITFKTNNFHLLHK